MTQRPLANSPVVSPTTGELLKDFIPDGEKPGAIGGPVSGVSEGFRHDCQKELTSKLAWAMGTFYNVPYSGKQTEVHKYVARAARAILRDHGYPARAK